MPYGAAKWGLAGATQSLRAEYAGTGVGFSVVIPGFVTGEGIFARHQANGVQAPAIFGTTTPQQVAQALVQAIRRDSPEILVTPRPLRPFLALAALAPGRPNDSWPGSGSSPSHAAPRGSTEGWKTRRIRWDVPR